jgi:hypothetical protein
MDNDAIIKDIEGAKAMVSQAQDKSQKGTDCWKTLDAIWEELDYLAELLAEA